jgi:hypothetical protein
VLPVDDSAAALPEDDSLVVPPEDDSAAALLVDDSAVAPLADDSLAVLLADDSAAALPVDDSLVVPRVDDSAAAPLVDDSLVVLLEDDSAAVPLADGLILPEAPVSPLPAEAAGSVSSRAGSAAAPPEADFAAVLPVDDSVVPEAVEQASPLPVGLRAH